MFCFCYFCCFRLSILRLEWEQHIDIEIIVPEQPDELGLCQVLEFHGQLTNTA